MIDTAGTDEGLYLNLELRSQGFTAASATTETSAAQLDKAIARLAATVESLSSVLVGAGRDLQAAGRAAQDGGAAVAQGAQAAAQGLQQVEQAAARVGTLSADAVARLKANVAEMRASLDASNFSGLAAAERAMANARATAAVTPAAGPATRFGGSDIAGGAILETTRKALAELDEAPAKARQKGQQTAAAFAEGILEAANQTYKLAMAEVRQQTVNEFLKPEEAAARGRAAATAFNEAVQGGMAEASEQGLLNDSSYTKLAGSLKNVEASAASAAGGMASLRRPLAAVSALALGIPGPVGQAAAAIGMFGAGSTLTIGVIAGAGLIATAWDVATTAVRRATDRIDKAAERIRALRMEAQSGEIRLALDVRDAETKIDQLTTKVSRWQRIASVLLPQGRAEYRDGQNALPSRAQDAQGGIWGMGVRGFYGALLGSYALNKAGEGQQQIDETKAGVAASGRRLEQDAQAHIDQQAADLTAIIGNAKARTAKDLAAVKQMTDDTRQALKELGTYQGRTPEERDYVTHLRAELTGRLQTLTAPFQKEQRADDKAARQQETTREQFRAVSENAKALVDGVTTTDKPLEQLTKRMADLDRAYDAIDHKTPEMVRQFASLKVQMQSAFEIMRQREAHQLALDLAEVEASLSVTSVDDMRVALARLEESLRQKDAPDAFIQHVHDVQSAIIDARGELERLDQQLRRVDDDAAAAQLSGTSKKDALTSRGLALGQLYGQAVTDSALATDPKSAEEFAREAEKIQQQMLENQNAITAATEKEDAARHRSLATMEKWVTKAAEGARALVGSLQTAGLLDQRMAKVADDAINAATALAKVIGSKGKDVGADLQVIASTVNVLKGLFGDSAEQKAHQRLVAENNRQLAALNQRVGALAAAGLAGNTIARVGAAVTQLVQATSGRAGALPITGSTKITNVGDVLAGYGLSPQDLEAVAKALGITIDGTVESYRALDQALKAADFKAFAESWAGALDRMQSDGIFHPSGSGLAGANATLTGLLNAFYTRSGSPALVNAFGAAVSPLGGTGIDTAAGRTAARTAATGLYDQYVSGKLTAGDFGDLSPQQFLDALKQIMAALDAATTAAEQDATAQQQAADAERAKADATAKYDAQLYDQENARKKAASDAAVAEQTAKDTETARLQQVNDTAREDLHYRELVAQGRDAEAAAYKRQLDERREMQSLVEQGADAETQATLRYVDALEDEKAATDAAAASAKEAAAAQRELSASALDAYSQAHDFLGTANSPVSFTQSTVIATKANPLIAQWLDGVDLSDPAAVNDAITKGIAGTDAGKLDQYSSDQISQFNQAVGIGGQLRRAGAGVNGYAPPGSATATGGGTANGAGDVQTIRESTAGRLVDFAAATAANTARMADVLALLAKGDGLVGPPRFGGAGGPTTYNVQGGQTVQFYTTIEYHAAPGAGAADDGTTAGNLFADHFNTALGGTLVVNRSARGAVGRSA